MRCPAAIAFLLSSACGPSLDNDLSDNDITRILVSPPPSDLGTTSQAVTTDVGYGGDGDSWQCRSPWADGECWVPLSRTFNISQYCANCDEHMTNGLITAIADWEYYLESNGFTVNPVGSGENVYAYDDSSLPGSILGKTTLLAYPNNDVFAPEGKYRRYHYADVAIDFERMKERIASGAYGSCRPDCKRRIYRNGVLHELGHVARLGHPSIGGMVMSSGWPISTASTSFTSVELSWLNRYRP